MQYWDGVKVQEDTYGRVICVSFVFAFLVEMTGLRHAMCYMLMLCSKQAKFTGSLPLTALKLATYFEMKAIWWYQLG